MASPRDRERNTTHPRAARDTLMLPRPPRDSWISQKQTCMLSKYWLVSYYWRMEWNILWFKRPKFPLRASSETIKIRRSSWYLVCTFIRVWAMDSPHQISAKSFYETNCFGLDLNIKFWALAENIGHYTTNFYFHSLLQLNAAPPPNFSTEFDEKHILGTLKMCDLWPKFYHKNIAAGSHKFDDFYYMCQISVLYNDHIEYVIFVSKTLII